MGIGSKWDLAVLAYWISGNLENLAGHVELARAGGANYCESAPEWPPAGKTGPRRGTAMLHTKSPTLAQFGLKWENYRKR